MTIEEEIRATIREYLPGADGEADSRTITAALIPLLNRVRAEAVREAGEEVEGWRQKITTAQIEANRGYLPVVQSALVGGMMQAEDILTERADRIEQNSEGDET